MLKFIMKAWVISALKANRKQYLQWHMKSTLYDVKYDCIKCEFKSTQKDKVKSHIRSVHEIPKYTCRLCEYKSAQKDTLKKQIETVHDGKRHPPH